MLLPLLLLAIALAFAWAVGSCTLAICRWFVRRYLLPDRVSAADERRYRRHIDAAADPFSDWLGIGGLDPAESDDNLDTLTMVFGNRPMPRTRHHPLGDYRLDSPLTQRAVSYLKSHVVIESDTPANRMVLKRHFQSWAREKGLRIAHIRHFAPVVVAAFFVKTEVDKDVELLMQSNAWKENQAAWEPPQTSKIVYALCWLLGMGRESGVRQARVV
jgi:hypothetical protein